MDTKRLMYFCTIVEQGQISRAARILNMSQPPLSQRLKELEDELGVTLIRREGHTWQVTEAGRVLYERARRLLDQLTEIPAEVKSLMDGAAGTIRIGASSTCASLFLKQLPGLQERFPRVGFSLLISDTNQLEDSVQARDVDFALVLLPVQGEDYILHLLPEDTFSVVVPAALAGAGRPATLGIEDLRDLPLICCRRWDGGGTFEHLARAFQRHQITPHILLKTPDVRTGLACLSRGVQAAAILPSNETPEDLLPGCTVHALDLPAMALHPALIHRKDHFLTLAAQAVIAAVVKG